MESAELVRFPTTYSSLVNTFTIPVSRHCRFVIERTPFISLHFHLDQRVVVCPAPAQSCCPQYEDYALAVI